VGTKTWRALTSTIWQAFSVPFSEMLPLSLAKLIGCSTHYQRQTTDVTNHVWALVSTQSEK
jgi:hypothetical protein